MCKFRLTKSKAYSLAIRPGSNLLRHSFDNHHGIGARCQFHTGEDYLGISTGLLVADLWLVCDQHCYPGNRPIILLWLVGFPPSTAPLASNNVLKSIGKGELLWAVMGMAAATCYELVSLQEIKTVKEWSSSIWIAFSLHLLLIVVAVLVVGLNSLDLPTGYVFSYPHVPDMRIFAGSILSLVLVIVTYSATHATLTDQEERNAKIRREEMDKKTMADKQAILDRIEQCLANATGSGKYCVKEAK